MKTLAFLFLIVSTASANNLPPVYSFSSPLTKSGNTIGCQAASGSQDGCLSQADWASFNGKIGVPAGGLTDQVLAKASNANGDLKWATASGGGLGAPAEMSLTYNPYWWGVPATFYGVNSDQDQTNQIVYYGSSDTASLTNNTSAVLINSGAVASVGPAAGNTGDIYVVTGSQQNSGSTGSTGNILINTGDGATPGSINITGGQNATTHAGGDVSLGSNGAGKVVFNSMVVIKKGSWQSDIADGESIHHTLGGSTASMMTIRGLNAAPVTLGVKSIDDGVTGGQVLVVVCNGASVTIKKSATVYTPGNADYTLTQRSGITFIWDGTAWYTIGVSAN